MGVVALEVNKGAKRDIQELWTTVAILYPGITTRIMSAGHEFLLLQLYCKSFITRKEYMLY